MSGNDAMKIMRMHAAQLGEHFANVQIHCSWPSNDGDSGSTESAHVGCGDFYARQGLAHSFIQRDRANDMGESVARAIQAE